MTCPLAKKALEQQTGADGARNSLHRLQRSLRHIFFGFDINHHVAHLRSGLQILRRDVNALGRENLVKRGQYARTVFMDMQQTAPAVQRQRHFREVNRRER